MIEMNAEIKRWQASELLPPDYRKILETTSKEELFECFGGQLGFGTGGMRGLMGVGPNRINDFTIKGATIGLAHFLLEKFTLPIRVLIAYDTRRDGQRFAHVAAQTLAHFQINSLLFKAPRPTPQLSYSVRQHQAQAGIVITASHNPSDYNGYKLYDEYGCQFVPRLAERVAHLMRTKEDYFAFALEDYQSLLDKGVIAELEQEEDESYLAFLRTLHPRVDINPQFKIVYSPLHGTGYAYGAKVLRDFGFNVDEVESQRLLDANFSTVKSPNPEVKETFTLAEKLGHQVKASLLLVTDPDGDRLGVAVFDSGRYVYLNGSMLGALLLDYLTRINPPKPGAVMITTIVTPKLGPIIAQKHGIKVLTTLTGFKFIGEQIEELSQDESFYFGYEESLGYLFSPQVRDKDAFQALIMTAHMFHDYFEQGKNITAIIEEMEREYGYFHDELLNYEFAGLQGKTLMARIMQEIRRSGETLFKGLDIASIEDYRSGLKITSPDHQGKLTLPSADVYRVIFNFGTVTFRPSGTEPKMKIYLSVHHDEQVIALTKFTVLKERITSFMAKYQLR
ncbi:MAG: phospho-sugar mutase [Bacilli bacterium]